MTRKSATMLLALVALWAPRASAQTAGTGGSGTTVTNNASGSNKGNINVILTKVGDKNYDTTKSLPLNLSDCINGKLTATLTSLPNSPQYPYLAVWWATGSGMCEEGNRGSRTPATSQCTRLSHNRENDRVNNYTNFAVEVDFSPVCQLNSDLSGGQDGKKELYFLLLSSKGSSEAAMFYGTLNFDLDLTPPDPPTITEAGVGQTDIPVKWSATIQTGDQFYVAADYSGGALERDGGVADADGGIMMDAGAGSGGCYSAYLKPGAKIDLSARPPGLLIAGPTTAREYSFTGEDFHGATKVPAVVVAKDRAGNVSAMSEVACLTVEPTSGFWNRYKQGDTAGTADPGCACSTPGARGRRAAGLAAIPATLLLACAWALRRIRRRAR